MAWNHTAEILGKYTQKGDQVAIAGRMQSRKYTNKEQQDVYVVECLVEDVTLISQGRILEGETEPIVDLD